MPLYTYVVTHKDLTYVIQARRSNFQGFGDWARDLPKSNLSPHLIRRVSETMYGGFEPIPNRVHAWKKSVPTDEGPIVVVAVQTVT